MPSAASTILAPAERATILQDWNDTAHPVPAATLPELFAAQAARTPDAIAVVCEDAQLSYAALDAQANQLAHHLRSLGVGPESIVGLCLERSLGMVVGLLGILKAGGAYLPLDPSYPPERLAFMLADAAAPVLVTTAALVDRLPPNTARLVQLDADASAIAAQPATAPRQRLAPLNTAYVIYTSGSTGTPKGVVVTPLRRRQASALMQILRHLVGPKRRPFRLLRSASMPRFRRSAAAAQWREAGDHAAGPMDADRSCDIRSNSTRCHLLHLTRAAVQRAGAG